MKRLVCIISHILFGQALIIMSFNKRNKNLNKSVEYSHRYNTQPIQSYYSQRTNKSISQRRLKSKSLNLGAEMQKKKEKDLKNEKMIRNIVRETYERTSFERVTNKRTIFRLPEKFQKIKHLSEERSHDILTNRICRECTHNHHPQTCELPPIVKNPAEKKRKMRKYIKKIKTREMTYEEEESYTDEEDLPDNSKLQGRITPKKPPPFYSPQKSQSFAQSSVNIVYQCDKESEGQNEDIKKKITESQSEQTEFQQNSEKLTLNNPLTVITIYQKNIDKLFDCRYLPQIQEITDVNQPLVKFPSQYRADQFVRKYVPKSQNIKMEDLIRSTLFEVDYQKSENHQSLYFGDKNYGVRHGLGVYVERNLIKEGKWVKDQLVHGIIQNKEYFYIGEVSQGGRHGHGKCNWKTGAIYVGDWVLDEMHGNGFWFDQKSNINYLGDWKFSRPQGLGVIKRKGFCSYEGEVLCWKPHGKGKQIFENSDIFQGSFYKGMPDGQGKYQWKKKYKFFGSFSTGSRFGKGKFEAPGVLKFEGNYERDLPNGDGRVIYVNNDQYKGDFKNGLREGKGTLTCKGKKKIFQGDWENDELKMAGEL